MDNKEEPEVDQTNNEDKNDSSNNKSIPATQQEQRITSRNPQWTYFKLQLIPHSIRHIKNLTLDPLTARTYLTAALSQFLGVMGTSISIDILKIENWDAEKSYSSLPLPPEVWIRAPRDDAAAVFAALSSWVGSLSATPSSYGEEAAAADGESGVAWRVCAKGNYLAAIAHGSGADVFSP